VFQRYNWFRALQLIQQLAQTGFYCSLFNPLGTYLVPSEHVPLTSPSDPRIAIWYKYDPLQACYITPPTQAFAALQPFSDSRVTMPHSTATEIPQLYVNDGPLPHSRVALMRASTPDTPIEELRKRYREDGYLLVKGVIPRADVLEAREAYFKFLSPCGVLEPGSKAVDGIFDAAQDVAKFPGIGSGAAGMNGHPGKQAEQFVDLALEAHTQEWYAEDLCRHPDLHEFVAKLTGWEESCKGLKRSLLRNNLPKTKAIGVHYDQIFLRHGEPTSITAWVPIGDIDITGGGLIYLEDSRFLVPLYTACRF
jgi:phytanoyl-CoA hydroxylase